MERVIGFHRADAMRAGEGTARGTDWRYELKLDGYHALGLKSEGHTRLYSRNGKDFSQRLPEVTRALAPLPDETAIDGEIAAVGRRSTALRTSIRAADR